ncbi:histidinol-phosphate transaminase [Streptomyces sp. NBC_01190]|uniref:histidinol-phosphate transaminase n=1 Tax=Streptomyces sp. NBC_01190 TaxID=2903767 RepID=UPI00386BFD5D|nr:histidinol-phosphate transaminase [Streptomyces sp. NBC_01190]
MSSSPPAPRGALDGIPAYVPKPPQPPSEGPSYRLFLNENPYPPLPSVRDAVLAASAGSNHYPEIFPTRLAGALAAKYDVPLSHVVTGPGSVGIYQQIGQAFLEPGDDVVYAWPSFEAYPIMTRMAGARPVEVRLRDHTHDLDALAAAITPRTRAVLLCEPNNPTGTAVGAKALEAFLDRVPGDVLVVLDEAYVEFSRSEDAVDGVALHRERPNLITLRTFSKAYGLAAWRVGYGFADPAVAEALRKCAVPCGVGRVAEEAALFSLTVEDELLARVEEIAKERDRLRDRLLAQGWPVVPSDTNFLWLPLGDGADAFAHALEAHGVLTRSFPGDGVRVTVGGREADDLLVSVTAGLAREQDADSS